MDKMSRLSLNLNLLRLKKLSTICNRDVFFQILALIRNSLIGGMARITSFCNWEVMHRTIIMPGAIPPPYA